MAPPMKQIELPFEERYYSNLILSAKHWGVCFFLSPVELLSALYFCDLFGLDDDV